MTVPTRPKSPPRLLNTQGSSAVTPEPLAQFSQHHSNEIGIVVRPDSNTKPMKISSDLSEVSND